MLSAVQSIQNFSVTAIKSIENIPGLPPIATFEEFIQAYNSQLPWNLLDAIDDVFVKFEFDFFLEIHEAAGKPAWSAEQWFDYLKAIQDNPANPFHDRFQQFLAIDNAGWDMDICEWADVFEDLQEPLFIQFVQADIAYDIKMSFVKLTADEKAWYQLAVDNYIKPVISEIPVELVPETPAVYTSYWD